MSCPPSTGHRSPVPGRTVGLGHGHHRRHAGNDDGYLVEAFIPWSVLGLGPEPGLEMGLNLNISDGDGSGGLEQMVSSNPDRTANNQARPQTWHSARLLDPG